MCFPLSDCFFCISLDVGAKIIGIINMVASTGLTILFGVPVILARDVLPFPRVCFYAAMAISSVALFVSACLLVVAAFSRKPSLMRPWVLIAWFTSAPLMCACVAGLATIPLRYAGARAAAEESCVISMYFVYAVLLFYFCSVVNSRRHELEQEKNTKVTERLMYPTIHNQYRDHV